MEKRTPAAGLGIAACGVLLLLLGTAAAVRGTELGELDAFRRLWSDMAIGIDGFLDARRPLAPDAELVYESGPDATDADQTYRRMVTAALRESEASPTRFWRTIPWRPFLATRLEPIPKDYDDHGRGHLLGYGFRLLGGIAPYLVLWLGAFAAAPVFFWACFEIARAGFPLAAALFAALLGFSCFFVESLALTRYAVGFYLVALLVVIALAAYACLRPQPTARGLAWRTLAAAVAFALVSTCRSSVGLLLPGLLLALLVGTHRIGGTRLRQALLFAALAALFVLPYPAMQRQQSRDVWQPVWEGLGDFDRTKGYTWGDKEALDFVRANGGRKLWTNRSEEIFRQKIADDVVQDPGWFAAILAKRAFAVVTQSKLWPWAPLGGSFIAESTSPNEGVMDKYYTYAATIDHFGLGEARIEVPIPLLLLPVPVLGIVAWRPGARRDAARAALGVAACVALATLALPVLITTAGGQETQAFAIAYLVAAAFLPDVLRRA